MLTPFIPCGAKIPVIALFAGAFFPESHWVSPLVYFVGILLVLLGGVLVKAITGQRYKKSYFIIELPDYKAPNVWSAVKVMFSRAKSYIIKAGTVILVSNALISIMASYTWTFREAAEDASNSILQTIAEPFAILLIPLGFGAWQLAAAAITGFVAKEEVVGTLAAVFAVSEKVISGDFELMEGAAFVEAIGNSGVELTVVAALGYLMFNLYTPPCFAAIGAMNAEIASKKWFFAGIGLQLAVGYTIAFLVYQIGTPVMHLVTGEGPVIGEGLIPGAIAVFLLISIIVMLIIKGNRRAKK